jgi:hypothetical protein
MKNYTYNFEVMTLVEQFVAAFNDIIVKNYDNNKELADGAEDIKVRFVMAPKQRVINTLINSAPGGLTVPAVAVTIATISRDASRVMNKNDGFLIPWKDNINSLENYKRIRQPVPVDITLNLSIVTKFQQHMDQILSNFIPYNDPYVVISWKFPQSSDTLPPIELRSPVIWNGTISLNYPADLNASQPYRITADTSFTIKGWIFKRLEEEIVKKIYYIDSRFSSISFKDKKSSLELLEFSETDTINTDVISISAVPPVVRYSSVEYISNVSESSPKIITLYGKYLYNPLKVFLIPSNSQMFSGLSIYNPFSGLDIESTYPAFSGIEIMNFSSQDETHLSFILSSTPLTSGYVDVLVTNEAGYGKLTTGASLRESLTSWAGIPYEPSPFIDGIKVNIPPSFIL